MVPEVQRYHSLVDEANMSESFFDDFMGRMRGAGITFGDRVSCHYLRPQMVSTEQYERIKAVVRTLCTALDKLGDEMLRVPALLDRVGLTAIEKHLAAIAPGYRRISPLARFDSFLSADALSFVELNAESPAGSVYTEILSDLFLDLPVMRSFQDAYQIHRFRTRERLVETLLGTYREWLGNVPAERRARIEASGRKLPNVAIVDWLDVPTYSEFELSKELFERHGMATAIADPRSLTYDGDRLRTQDGFEIDLLYKRVLTNEFIREIDRCQPMLAAYRDGAMCMVNSFRSKLLHKKMIFGLLTAEDLQHLFTPAEQETIRRHIPWTRRLEATHTVFEGQNIDLVPWTKANRETLVLKPNDEYGGKGIHVGWTLTDDQWARAVDESLGEDYLVQRKVELSYMDFPTFRDGQLRFERQLVDLDPYVFDGEVEGILTRLSSTALANVTAGAGIVPTFVISAR